MMLTLRGFPTRLKTLREFYISNKVSNYRGVNMYNSKGFQLPQAVAYHKDGYTHRPLLSV